MAEYGAVISWHRDGEAFTDLKYSRRHVWQFDGGVEVLASSSPHVVPPPASASNAVDPEEAFVASLSSCHMLWFLSIAARRSFIVESYRDSATGVMESIGGGRMAMTKVTLRPDVRFAGDVIPDRAQIDDMHREAHESCYIANSVRTEVTCIAK